MSLDRIHGANGGEGPGAGFSRRSSSPLFRSHESRARGVHDHRLDAAIPNPSTLKYGSPGSLQGQISSSVLGRAGLIVQKAVPAAMVQKGRPLGLSDAQDLAYHDQVVATVVMYSMQAFQTRGRSVKKRRLAKTGCKRD